MYDLHALGWKSFQQLCLTIAREVLGQTVESFLDANDAGMDGAFAGRWSPTDSSNESLAGQFVIQCKFTSKPHHSIRRSNVSGEVEKVKRLVEQGRCDSYLLLTNFGVSGAQNKAIKALFEGIGVKHIVVLDSTWISQQIRECKRLRMLVPRMYGLGDLSQILDERAYSQARAILELLREDLGKIVVTGVYQRAAAALDKHGFVLLIGAPAAGKTTIASLLAMAAVDQWNASLLKLDTPGKLEERWNPDEPSQFFWLDDAFGVAQYEAFLVQGWNHILPQIKAMLRRGAKIVMTSRDYIYNRARKDLKEGAFPLLQESQVVIDVHDLTLDEKRQILYNHLKLGRQSAEFRSKIKPYLESVAAHERFIPETARRLAEPLFTAGLSIDRYTLSKFVDKRERFLQEVLQGLDRHSRASLALIYMCNGLVSPIHLREAEGRALERLGSDLGRCITALEALNGSLVQLAQHSGYFIWRFKHPTIGDAYAALLAQSPELLGIYVQGSTPEKLMEQVTCGDVGLRNAVIIPESLFTLMLLRLDEMATSTAYKEPWLARWGAKSSVQGFLARRCSKAFLAFYLREHPDLLEEVSEPGLMLDSVSEVDLAIRLNEFGLLPEDRRKRFVATVSDYALEGQDLFGLGDPGIRSVFKDDEFEELLERVRTDLIPRLKEVRWEWESNWDSTFLSASGYMQPLIDSFEVLRAHFADDESAIRIVEEETKHANWWIGDNIAEDPEPRPSRKLGSVGSLEEHHGPRSIFEDVDT